MLLQYFIAFVYNLKLIFFSENKSINFYLSLKCDVHEKGISVVVFFFHIFDNFQAFNLYPMPSFSVAAQTNFNTFALLLQYKKNSLNLSKSVNLLITLIFYKNVLSPDLR